jgi:hypothetical protein
MLAASRVQSTLTGIWTVWALISSDSALDHSWMIDDHRQSGNNSGETAQSGSTTISLPVDRHRGFKPIGAQLDRQNLADQHLQLTLRRINHTESESRVPRIRATS